MSLWEQTRSQRWALVAGLLIGLLIGATVAILFRPLIIALVLILLALLVYRVVKAVRGGGKADPTEPRVRGMMVTGRYGETMRSGTTVDISGRDLDPDPAPVTRQRAGAPADKVEPVATATPETRRGPEYDAEIDAILANIDRQITGEGAAPRRRGATPPDPTTQSRSDASRVQDADWSER